MAVVGTDHTVQTFRSQMADEAADAASEIEPPGRRVQRYERGHDALESLPFEKAQRSLVGQLADVIDRLVGTVPPVVLLVVDRGVVRRGLSTRAHRQDGQRPSRKFWWLKSESFSPAGSIAEPQMGHGPAPFTTGSDRIAGGDRVVAEHLHGVQRELVEVLAQARELAQ